MIRNMNPATYPILINNVVCIVSCLGCLQSKLMVRSESMLYQALVLTIFYVLCFISLESADVNGKMLTKTICNSNLLLFFHVD